MILYELWRKLEDAVSDVIRSTLRADWLEDPLSVQVLQRIRRAIDGSEPQDGIPASRVSCRFFKQTGAQEHRYGDIGIVCALHHPDGLTLSGVAFLEAKRRDPGSARFDALDPKQARRIERHSPSARLLLYDRDPVLTTAMVPPHWVDAWGRAAGAVIPTGSYSITVPITHYTATGVRDRRLYRWGHPFSYQFVFRYLQGLDLDLRPAIIASATGFADARDVPTHLLFVRVAPIGEPEPDRIPVNPDLLDEIPER